MFNFLVFLLRSRIEKEWLHAMIVLGFHLCQYKHTIVFIASHDCQTIYGRSLFGVGMWQRPGLFSSKDKKRML